MTKKEITVDNFYTTIVEIDQARGRDHLDKYFYDYCMEYLALRGVPEQYRAKVRAKAWEDGHAYGYVEVAIHITELADIFE